MSQDGTKIEQFHQVFIGEKDGMFAVVALDVNQHGTCLGRTDFRNTPPITLSPCQSPEVGRRQFEGSIESSIKNGWKIAYLGKRNEG